MHKTKYGLLALALVLVGGGSLWAWRHFRDDPEIARMTALGEQVRADSKNLPEDKRRELWRQFGEEMRQLSPDQRRALFAANRERWQEREQQSMEDFFALAPPDRQKALDKRIDEDERRKKEAQKRRAQQGTKVGQGGGPMRTGQFAGRGQNRTLEEKSARRNQMLDRSSPEQRAMRAEFRRLMDERRRQRGLPPSPRRGWA
jgi:hypothetical protein